MVLLYCLRYIVARDSQTLQFTILFLIGVVSEIILQFVNHWRRIVAVSLSQFYYRVKSPQRTPTHSNHHRLDIQFHNEI
jgi:hypothetical protein